MVNVVQKHAKMYYKMANVVQKNGLKKVYYKVLKNVLQIKNVVQKWGF